VSAPNYEQIEAELASAQERIAQLEAQAVLFNEFMEICGEAITSVREAMELRGARVDGDLADVFQVLALRMAREDPSIDPDGAKSPKQIVREQAAEQRHIMAQAMRAYGLLPEE